MYDRFFSLPPGAEASIQHHSLRGPGVLVRLAHPHHLPGRGGLLLLLLPLILLLLLLLLLTLVRGDNYFLLETYKDSADSQSGTVHTATTHKCRHGLSNLSVKRSKK